MTKEPTTEDDCGYFDQSKPPCPRCAAYQVGQMRSDDRLINVREAAQAVLDSALESFNGNVEVSGESLTALEKALLANEIPGVETE